MDEKPFNNQYQQPPTPTMPPQPLHQPVAYPQPWQPAAPLPAPPSPQSPAPVATKLSGPAPDEPVAVIRVLSVRGVEYAMMTIALWFAATGLVWVVLNVVNDSANFNFLVVPLSVLITSVPIFTLLFIRLKRAELANPSLRLEPSKRRLSQLTQILAFLACLINITVFVYSVLQKINGTTGYSIGKSILSLLVVLVVAGGTLTYYWFDEHRIRS
ncbi:hypothetical protein HYW36_02990 [Candidatus Saccharibacteria bacterium]|nr:hypothetical protein [Candidatus Saccharibacteria bacterium]